VGSITRSLWGRDPGPVESSAVEGLANMPYAVANLLVRCQLLNTHIPVMFWRSVGSSQNAFAMESFVDEMAHAAGADPCQFRRELLAHQPDLLRVLDTVAEKSGWGTTMPAKPGLRSGRGISIHESFGTIVAEVAEVAVDQAGAVRVERIVAAVDCGTVVNPRIATMQVESAVIYGLTAAMYDTITIRDGAVVQGNFDTYPMVRMAQTPVIETHLVPSGRPIGGLGEPGTPPVAPAVCNAIFAATGVRIRSLPIAGAKLAGTI
jgi:isoquinoline 1-oxidoreductase beta subunit